jgi:hypothetical protein
MKPLAGITCVRDIQLPVNKFNAEPLQHYGRDLLLQLAYW